MQKMDIDKLLEQRKILIDKKLDEILPGGNIHPKKLHKAMRYSVFSGGKRIRPILAIESCLCCGGAINDVMLTACAIELVHTFSLIHDDLPAMDDDDYRRGKPSCHKKFDEATAILAGDSLLSLALEILSTGKKPAIEIKLIKELTSSIGSLGMAGGQAMDVEHEGKKKDPETLNYINLQKTGALMRASLKMGAMAARASSKNIDAMSKFGKFIGEVFQVVDDILDRGDYIVLCGEENARKKAGYLTKKAKEALAGFGSSAERLKNMADYLTGRKS